MNIFWFRRDLRLKDNTGLNLALAAVGNTLPLFIYDVDIVNELPENDARVGFIYNQLYDIHKCLESYNAGLLIAKGKPEQVFKNLIETYPIKRVFFNRDYEPYALQRDKSIEQLLRKNGIEVFSYKDHVVFEPDEVLKTDGKAYTVYTPYKNSWLKKFTNLSIKAYTEKNFKKFHPIQVEFPSLRDLGFEKSKIKVKPYDLSVVGSYHLSRDIPFSDTTSHLGPHLRFGTISIREIILKLDNNYGENYSFLNELIWREFFIQILYHFPHVVDNNFKSKYNKIEWRNNEEEFDKWCAGKTGYPIVDAGIRQLNQTGYMHNRVRMITAGFLCKHLLIDWRWGEAYFAFRLLDFELSSNNGNWQWAAGTGCDAAPYFRIFNPWEQTKKYDPELEYVKKWIDEINSLNYPAPIVEHKFARQRAIERYKTGLANN